jgi:hypothetical protein
MGKYQADPLYRDNYAFYAELLADTTRCHPVERVPVQLPFGFLSPDPELKDSAAYLFDCRDRGAGPDQRPARHTRPTRVTARAAATAR